MAYDIHTAAGANFVTDAAAWMAARIEAAIADHGSCVVGLSGGSTPRPIYEALGKQSLPWGQITIFLVDERYVPAADLESNQRLVKQSFPSLSKHNLLTPNTALPLEECIADYARSLISMIDDRLPDLVVLGMGEDGHIASLFPPVSEEGLGDTALVVHTTTDRFAVRDRISVSLNLLNGAQQQLLLLKGEGKKKVWEEMLASSEDEHRWPMKRILQQGNLTVMIGM